MQDERTTQNDRGPDRPDVAAMLATDLADNSHALYLEERRLAVETAAAGLAVDSALQDFYRDRMAYVIDAGTASLRLDWRRERDTLQQNGENLTNAVGYRAWDDSTAEALQMLAREWLATAVDFTNWITRAGDLLNEEWDGGTLAEAAAVLRELRALQDSPEADPIGGEVPAALLAEQCQLDTAALAGRLEILRQLGLCGTRYVGGTSGTLVHACNRPPVSAYVPDAVTLLPVCDCGAGNTGWMNHARTCPVRVDAETRSLEDRARDRVSD